MPGRTRYTSVPLMLSTFTSPGMSASLSSWPTKLLTLMVAMVLARVAACQHMAVLDQRGDFVMRWTPMEERIRVEIQVATKGWVGIGFSPNGGMRGADITLGWVDLHGELHVHDRHAHSTTTPVVDHSQDVEVEGGYQNDTHTVIRFSRLWNTCDTKQDFKLSGDTTRVIWAFGEEDPVDEMTMERHVQRGVKSIFLQEPGFTLPPLTDEIETWDVRAPNVTLPSDTDTLYWCKLHKTPDFINNVHLVGFQPLISRDRTAYVHHILLYACTGSLSHLEKWAQHDGAQCYTSNMPPSWLSCRSVIIAWAVGSEGETWPDDVGITLGGQSGYNYFVMEIHYDNPRLTKGIVDDSGVRLLYTRNRRKNEAGVLKVGHAISHHLVIPPGQTWRTVGRCGSPCLEAVIPAEGVKVIQVLLHAHLLGRGITLRHIRGDRELPIVLQDLNYDFNYQIGRRLNKELTVLPGDSFILECQYDAKQRTTPTFGGESTNDEMCLAFLLYYPKVPLSVCYSHPTLENVYHPLGVKNIHTQNNGYSHETYIKERERELAEALLERKETPGIEDFQLSAIYKKMIVREPTSLSNKTMHEILYDKKTWSDEGKLKALQKQVEYGTHQLICKMDDRHVRQSYENPHFITINMLDSDCSETHRSQVYQPVITEVKKASPSVAQQPTITSSLLLSSLVLLLLFLK